MNNERNDIHRPSAIIPANYEFVGFDYCGPEPFAVSIAEKRILREHMDKTNGQYAGHKHGGSCMICGAHAFYLCVFHHAISNEYIECGEDCANKMHFSYGNMNAFRKQIGLARVMVAGQRKAFAFLADKELARAYEIWEMDYDNLPKSAVKGAYNEDSTPLMRVMYEEMTVRDIVSKLIRYGSISDAQVNFLRNLLVKIDQRPIIEAARKAEYDNAGPVPTGRQTVSGTVLALKTTENNTTYFYGDSGIQTKVLIQLENGCKVWGNRFANIEKGQKITFKATFEQSKDDIKFGFFKRPIAIVEP